MKVFRKRKLRAWGEKNLGDLAKQIEGLETMVQASHKRTLIQKTKDAYKDKIDEKFTEANG